MKKTKIIMYICALLSMLSLCLAGTVAWVAMNRRTDSDLPGVSISDNRIPDVTFELYQWEEDESGVFRFLKDEHATLGQYEFLNQTPTLMLMKMTIPAEIQGTYTLKLTADDFGSPNFFYLGDGSHKLLDHKGLTGTDENGQEYYNRLSSIVEVGVIATNQVTEVDEDTVTIRRTDVENVSYKTLINPQSFAPLTVQPSLADTIQTTEGENTTIWLVFDYESALITKIFSENIGFTPTQADPDDTSGDIMNSFVSYRCDIAFELVRIPGGAA